MATRIAVSGLAAALLLASPTAPSAAESFPAGRTISQRHMSGPVAVQVLRVIDGDTFEARVRIWFGQDVTVLVRLSDFDAPELGARCEAERVIAQEAARELADLLASGRVLLHDLHLDKYGGRVVARVRIEDTARDAGFPPVDLASAMLAGGYGRAYGGKARGNWCRQAGFAAPFRP